MVGWIEGGEGQALASVARVADALGLGEGLRVASGRHDVVVARQHPDVLAVDVEGGSVVAEPSERRVGIVDHLGKVRVKWAHSPATRRLAVSVIAPLDPVAQAVCQFTVDIFYGFVNNGLAPDRATDRATNGRAQSRAVEEGTACSRHSTRP